LASLGSAAFHPPAATIASSSSTARRGAAVSVFSVGGNLGTAFSPLWIALIISWVGVPGTALLIPVALIVSLLLYQQFSRADISSTRGTHTLQKVAQESRPKGSTMGLILIIAAVMCRSWFQLSLVTYLPEWMHSRGWSLAAAGQILAALLISVSVGSLLGGIISDKIGRWQVVALSMTLLSPAMWLFVTTSGLLQVTVAGAIGVFIGASFPVTIVMAQEVWPQGVGLASALVMGLGWLPGGIGAFFTGYIADLSSLDLGLQSLIIPPIIGLICILVYAVLYRHPVKNKILSNPAG
jgi:FSR family fosmidomycin resistance protein-like MFS transporter